MTAQPRRDPHPVFVGREEVIENLTGAINAALSGNGQCIVLSGEAGIGKTRLIEEILTRAYNAGFVTFEGLCNAENLSPYGGFQDIFRSLCSTERSMMGRERSSNRSEIMEKTRAISSLDDLLSASRDRGRPDPRIKSDRIRYATLDLVRSIAKDRPSLIVVEDLQWADSATAELFQTLARNCKDARIVLIGSYRTEDMENNTTIPAKAILEGMIREGLAREIELNRLTADDINIMLPSLLGKEIDRQVYKLIETGSEGNPLLVVELTRNLIESGNITEVDEYWIVDPSKPIETSQTSLDDLLLDRLGKINWIEGRVMEVASLIGMDIDAELLAKVMGSYRTEIESILRDITSKTGLLVITFHGFQFRHNKVREILSDRISEPLRKELHLALAESLEKMRNDKDREEEIAWHYRFTDNDDKCIEYSLASADRMLNAFALDEAFDFYNTVLRKTKGSNEIICQVRRALEGAGICLEEQGEFNLASEMFNRYLETCPSATDRTRVLIRLIECWGPSRRGTGDLEPEKLLMEYLLDIGPVEGVDLAHMHDLMANTCIWENKYEDVIEHRKQAEKIYLEHGMKERYALELSFHAYTLLSMDRLEEAEKNINTALSIFRDHPYNYGMMDAEMCSGEILMSLGQDDESISHFEKSANLAAEIGEHIMEYWIRCYLSLQQLELGWAEESRSSLRRAEQVARLVPTQFANSAPIAFQAFLEARTGHPERSIALAETAIKILEDYKFPRVHRAIALLAYANALYEQGEIELAAQRFDEGVREIRRCPSATIFEARAHWWMGICMIDQGNNLEGRSMLQKARPIFERIDNFRMMKIIDQTLKKISLMESMSPRVTIS